MKDIAASVTGRLQNKARERKRPFDEVLQYYAIERFEVMRKKQQAKRGNDLPRSEFVEH